MPVLKDISLISAPARSATFTESKVQQQKIAGQEANMQSRLSTVQYTCRPPSLKDDSKDNNKQPR
jgi:hypothetical protein